MIYHFLITNNKWQKQLELTTKYPYAHQFQTQVQDALK